MNRGLIIALVSAVVILAVGVAGIAGYVFLVMPKGAETVAAPAKKAEEETPPTIESKFYQMDHFVTNLADADRLRYIDVTIALGVKTEEAKTLLKDAEPQIRDLILSQIRSLTSADLSGPQGKERMATAVEKVLMEKLKEHLTKVYVTDMVIQ